MQRASFGQIDQSNTQCDERNRSNDWDCVEEDDAFGVFKRGVGGPGVMKRDEGNRDGGKDQPPGRGFICFIVYVDRGLFILKKSIF